MLKGVQKVRSMTDEKIRDLAEEESNGVIDADDEDNIIKPKDGEKFKAMVEALEKMVDLFDRVEKEQMFNTTGARGLGIDLGGTESPRGPTSLTTEESIPDWDMIKRPTEDSEEEYPNVRNDRLKRKNKEQSNVYEPDLEED